MLLTDCSLVIGCGCVFHLLDLGRLDLIHHCRVFFSSYLHWQHFWPSMWVRSVLTKYCLRRRYCLWFCVSYCRRGGPSNWHQQWGSRPIPKQCCGLATESCCGADEGIITATVVGVALFFIEARVCRLGMILVWWRIGKAHLPRNLRSRQWSHSYFFKLY